MANNIEYKIEKNVPIMRAGRIFDETQPEFITMMKLKPGESFEFPANRVGNVHSCRLRITKDNPALSFTATGKNSLANKKLKSGRCWRLPDGSHTKYKSRK